MKSYLLYKFFRKLYNIFKIKFDFFVTYIIFWGNNVQLSNFKTYGVPYISVANDGIFNIGNNLMLNNGIFGNPIGCYNRCTFFVDRGANLIIGDNFGISQAAIICHLSIKIGNNVKIGGGVSIFDTDFHSLQSILRSNLETDLRNKKKLPIVIEDNVFVGAYSTILKGVSIGKNSIIGACSVVTKNIPENEIWAGNPARFIRKL